jgi:hypothetical protein
MHSLVLPALRRTGIANLGTDRTYLLHELRAATHISGRRPANLRAILIEANAFRHHLHVGFIQTGIRAMFALLGATNARLDARTMFVVGHDKLLSSFLGSYFSGVGRLIPTRHQFFE